MNMKNTFDKLRELGAHGIIISKGGETIADERWSPDLRRNLYSVTKSFTSCAFGIAMSEGLISLDENLADVFCDELPEHIDENLAAAKTRDLLTMCLGHERTNMIGDRTPYQNTPDWVKMLLAEPFDYAPGTHFHYSNVGSYLAGVLIGRRAGCTLAEYLNKKLFAPLGIEKPNWESDPLGRTFGASGLELSISALHRIGQLWLAGGEGIIPEEWLKECTKPQDADYYGYLFWLDEKSGTFRADGKFSQLCIISPEKEAVVTVTAHEEGHSFIKGIIIDEILLKI